MSQEVSREVNQILADATLEQAKWVMARLVSKTDKEAAKEVGVNPSTVCRWPNKAELDRAVKLLLREQAAGARAVLSGHAIEAAWAVVEELDGKNKLRAAEAILDRTGLPRSQSHELTGEGGGPVAVKVVGLDPYAGEDS